MKNSNSNTAEHILNTIISAVLGLTVLGLLGFLIYLDFYISKPSFSLIWILLLPIFGLIVNKITDNVSGDKPYNPNWIDTARKGKGIVKQNKRRTRKVVTTFIELVLFALLLIRFIALLSVNKIFAIIGIICSAICLVIYLIIGVIPTE